MQKYMVYNTRTGKVGMFQYGVGISDAAGLLYDWAQAYRAAKARRLGNTIFTVNTHDSEWWQHPDYPDPLTDQHLLDWTPLKVAPNGSVVCPRRPAVASPDGPPDLNPKTAVGLTKSPLGIVPAVALHHEALALADGMAKYGKANWRERGVSTSVYINAALRHLMAYYDGGERLASDSKVHHLGHARACLAIILDAEAAGTLNDDRPKPNPALAALLATTSSESPQ